MGRFALLVGISEYKSELSPLPSAARDVEALRRVLQHPEIGQFANSDVEVLVNQDKHKIEYAIYTLFDNRKKDDLLLFYFSGHGIADEHGDFYLSAHSTQKNNGKLVPPTAIAASYVHTMMNRSKSKHQVVILDCCYSGAFARGMTAKDGGTVNILPQLGGEGRAILTASNSTQYAFEQEGFDLSLYTHFLVEAIEKGGADADNDGDISVDELYEYVKDKVQEANNQMTPEFYPVKEGHKIILAKSPKDDPKLKFRKEFEEFVKKRQGKFSKFDEGLRNAMRAKWKVEPLEAKQIESEILRPYDEYNRKLKDYEEVLVDALQAGEDVLSETAQVNRKEYWEFLGLREEDVVALENRVLAFLKADYEHQQQEAKKLGQEQVKNEDVTRIEESVVEQADASYQEHLKQQEQEDKSILNWARQQNAQGNSVPIEAIILADNIAVNARRFWKNLTGGSKNTINTVKVTEEEIDWDDLPEDVKQAFLKSQNESEK